MSASPDHALLIQIARAHLRWFRDAGENAHRIEPIELALATYKMLAEAAMPNDAAATPPGPEAEVDYRAAFETALEARDAAGYLGTSPAETIRRLAEERDAAHKTAFPDDLTLETVAGRTTLTFCGGKYSFVLDEDGDYLIEIKRYGHSWSSEIVGPGEIVFGRAIGCLARIVVDALQRARVPQH